MTASNEKRLVQLAVRVPAGLRQSVRGQAEASGLTVQQWVTEKLAEAVETEANPEALLAAELVSGVRAALAESLRDGTYARVADELGREDPEIATV